MIGARLGKGIPLLVVLAFVAVLTAAFTSIQSRLSLDIVVVQVPVSTVVTEPEQAPPFAFGSGCFDGARIVSLPEAGDPVVLTPEFVGACDPDVSFDGSEIVFSGRRTQEDSWQIWKMNADGSEKVQITHDLVAATAPSYAGSRFYLNDPAPTPQIIFAGYETESGGFALYGTDVEGQTVRRLTFNLRSDFYPDVLPNGRIVFSSLQNHGNPHSSVEAQALFGVNLDGSDLMPYYGNHEGPRFKGMVHISDFDDRVYFVESDSVGWLGGGNISSLSQRRPLHSHRRLTQDADGAYHSPTPLPGGGLLASYKEDEPGTAYGLYRIDPESGRRMDVLFEDPGWHTIDAQILAPHPIVKGRSNWLVPGSTTGVFYALNSYRTDLGELEELTPGTIKHVRVIEGVPVGDGPAAIRSREEFASDAEWMLATAGGRRLLGVAPVEEDGSFHIRVPAETPITFQLLDEDYVARRTQKAWTWVMGNENRGCIGCHEDRELSPPNAVVDAVLKPAVELTLPPERRRTVDFKNQIFPILAQRCATAGCHVPGGVRPILTGDPRDTTDASALAVYRGLLDEFVSQDGRRMVFPGRAKDSPLIWSLFGRRLHTEVGSPAGSISQMPPREPLSLRERILLIEWVDLGAYWDARPEIEEDPSR